MKTYTIELEEKYIPIVEEFEAQNHTLLDIVMNEVGPKYAEYERASKDALFSAVTNAPPEKVEQFKADFDLDDNFKKKESESGNQTP